MILKKVLMLVLGLAFLVDTSGCYVYKGYVPEVTNLSLKEMSIKPIPVSANLELDLKHAWEGGTVDEDWILNKRIKEVKTISEEVFGSSGLFKQVGYVLPDKDLNIELYVEELEKGSPAAAILCGITLMLIPVKTGVFFDVKATVKDRKGKVLGEYRSKGDFNVILQILFIIPIGWRLGMPKNVYKNIFQDILVQMNEDRPKLEMAI